MITFQSLAYYFYAMVGVAIMWKTPKESKKLVFLLINTIFISLLFFFKKKQLVIMGAFFTFNYILLKYLEHTSRKYLVASIQITISLIVLFFFKYELFQQPILALFPKAAMLLKPITFVGISFFSFRLMSLVFDTIYNTRKKLLNPVDYLNYLMFFPCFLSGPLDRYDRFVDDFDNAVTPNSKQIYDAVYRIVFGAFKKGIIADSLYELCLASFHTPEMETMTFTQIMIGQYIYSVVLYLDFSGYSDIAIGVSNLYGVKTPENFHSPYFKRNMQEFWNSWHVSFLEWLRDYIYMPIQKMFINLGYRNFTVIACVAYLATFFIAGVWHGDTIHYTLYGISHGVAFTVYILYKKLIDTLLSKDQRKRYMTNKTIRVLSNLITYHYFLFSLFFFLGKTDVYRILWNRIIN